MLSTILHKPIVAGTMNHLLGELPWDDGTFRRDKPKVGRNDPCPCGIRKKYEKVLWEVMHLITALKKDGGKNGFRRKNRDYKFPQSN